MSETTSLGFLRKRVEQAIARSREAVRHFGKLTAVPVSKNQLANDLLTIGVRAGDILALGISLKSIGYVDGGADALIDVLLGAVGPTGTLMIPTYNQMFPLATLNPGNPAHIFAPLTTPSYTGIVAERMRARSDARRSRHPSNSVAAIGQASSCLTKDHDEATGAYSPYSTLAELGGRFLGIGIGDRLVGVRHEAQARAGLLEIVSPSHGILYRDAYGGLETFVRRDPGGCVRHFPDVVTPMRAQGIVRDGMIGHAKAILAEVRDALEFSTAALLENPASNLCDDRQCTWCAALARKLGQRHNNPFSPEVG